MSSLMPSSNVTLECFSYMDMELPQGHRVYTKPVSNGRRGTGSSLDSVIHAHT